MDWLPTIESNSIDLILIDENYCDMIRERIEKG